MSKLDDCSNHLILFTFKNLHVVTSEEKNGSESTSVCDGISCQAVLKTNNGSNNPWSLVSREIPAYKERSSCSKAASCTVRASPPQGSPGFQKPVALSTRQRLSLGLSWRWKLRGKRRGKRKGRAGEDWVWSRAWFLFQKYCWVMKPELIHHLDSQAYFCVILIRLLCVCGQLLDQVTELHVSWFQPGKS